MYNIIAIACIHITITIIFATSIITTTISKPHNHNFLIQLLNLALQSNNFSFQLSILASQFLVLISDIIIIILTIIIDICIINVVGTIRSVEWI